jgi:hypothetical protein
MLSYVNVRDKGVVSGFVDLRSRRSVVDNYRKALSGIEITEVLFSILVSTLVFIAGSQGKAIFALRRY